MSSKSRANCPNHQLTLHEIEAEIRRLHAEEAAGLSRRDFLRTASIAALGAGFLASGVGGLTDRFVPAASAEPAAPETPVVARVKHPKAVIDGKPDPEVVDLMVNRVVCLLTGKKDPAAAWKEMFSPKDVVGVKINWIAGKGMSTSREVSDAIIKALLKLGVAENNIIVWDSDHGRVTAAGYTFNTGTTGLRAYDAPDAGYSEPYPLQQYGGSARLTKILTEQITAMINVPILKDHGGSGVTFALKNIALGATNNPGSLHNNFCDPSIGEVNAIDVVRQKQRLILGDALVACYNGGPGRNPQFVWTENAVFAAHDPVAIDACALKIIEDKRKEKGIAAIGNHARHVQTAARLGLGVADLGNIKRVGEELT